MTADRSAPPVPDMPLSDERRRRILTEGAARFRRRRRRNGAVFTVAGILVVAASVALIARAGQPATQVATRPPVAAGPSAGMASTTLPPGAGSTSPTNTGSTMSSAGLREPTTADVKDGRFVRSVALDGGALVVSPAPADLQPTTPKDTAQQHFWATEELAGAHRTIVFGFGLVTISTSVPGDSTVNGRVVSYRNVPAWVGFALDPPQHTCGVQTGPLADKIPVGEAGNGEAVTLPAWVRPGETSPDLQPGATGPVMAMQPFVYLGSHGVCRGVAFERRITPQTLSQSVPWTLVSQGSGQAVIRYDSDCTMHVHGPVVQSANPTAGTATIELLVGLYAGAAPSCPARPGPPPTATVDLPLYVTKPLLHARTGLVYVVQGPGTPTE